MERQVKHTTETPSVRVEMDRELYNQFKLAAKQEGKTRQEILLSFVREFVRPYANPLDFL